MSEGISGWLSKSIAIPGRKVCILEGFFSRTRDEIAEGFPDGVLGKKFEGITSGFFDVIILK